MLGDSKCRAVIPASDLGRAKTFYENTLGLKIVREEEAGVEFACGDGTSISLYPTPSAGQAPQTLATWEVPDLDAEIAELRSRGVTFEEYDMPGLKTKDGIATIGSTKGAWFKDSEGNILSVTQH